MGGKLLRSSIDEVAVRVSAASPFHLPFYLPGLQRDLAYLSGGGLAFVDFDTSRRALVGWLDEIIGGFHSSLNECVTVESKLGMIAIIGDYLVYARGEEGLLLLFYNHLICCLVFSWWAFHYASAAFGSCHTT